MRDGLGGILAHELAVADHAVERLKCQVGIHGARAITDQQRRVVYLARLAGLEHERHAGAETLADEIMMQAGDGEQALAVVRQNAIDLAIIDVMMPTMGGLEFRQRLADERTALTAQINSVDTTAATSSPFDSVQLPAAVMGAWMIVVNNTANPMQVFGAASPGTDTINENTAPKTTAAPAMAFVALILTCDPDLSQTSARTRRRTVRRAGHGSADSLLTLQRNTAGHGSTFHANLHAMSRRPPAATVAPARPASSARSPRRSRD